MAFTIRTQRAGLLSEGTINRNGPAVGAKGLPSSLSATSMVRFPMLSSS